MDKSKRLLLRREDISLLLFSIVLQVLLATLLGHYYDMRVFMATGYGVVNGLNPYEPHVLNEVFQHPHFQTAIPGIGYPPPWSLLLGFIYLLSFYQIPSLLLYNLAIKVPIIIGNIVLAYLVRNTLIDLKVGELKVRAAWLFLLFNPLLLYTTSAWGQFDTLVALLSLAALRLLFAGRIRGSATLLALAVALKPVALPLIPLSLIFLAKRSPRRALGYSLIFTPILVLISALPFYVLDWSLTPIFSNWDFHFTMAGGLSYITIYEYFTDITRLPESMLPLGLLWIPALAVGSYAYSRTSTRSFQSLLWSAVGLILIFFLTRSWVSEQNVNLILPMMLILASAGGMSRRSLHLIWIIPLVFTIFNSSLHQLFFIIYPDIMAIYTDFHQGIRGGMLIARTLSVVPWQILGWSIVVKGLVRGDHQDVNYPHLQP